MKKGSLIFNLILLSFLLTMSLLSLNYDRKTALVPLLTGIFTFVFAFLSLLSEIFPAFGQKFSINIFHIDNSQGKEDKSDSTIRWNPVTSFIILSSWLVLFYLSVFLVGFIISIPVFLFLFHKIYSAQPWWKSTGFALISWAFIYILFVKLMSFDLFSGVLQGDYF